MNKKLIDKILFCILILAIGVLIGFFVDRDEKGIEDKDKVNIVVVNNTNQVIKDIYIKTSKTEKKIDIGNIDKGDKKVYITNIKNTGENGLDIIYNKVDGTQVEEGFLYFEGDLSGAVFILSINEIDKEGNLKYELLSENTL